MDKVITLPKSGATVVLGNPNEIKQKDREIITSLINPDDNELTQTYALLKGILRVLIKSWTLDAIIPSAMPDSLGELYPEDFDALGREVKDYIPIVIPDFLTKSQDTDSPKDNSNA